MPTRKRPRSDPKAEALRQRGTLNSRAAHVTDELFQQSEFFDARDLVQVKYEMIRRVEIEGAPVVGAAKAFGFSRPSFYAAHAAYARDGLAGLLPQKRGPKSGHKLHVELVAFLVEARAGDPSLSTPALALLVKERFGVDVHPRSVERALARQEKKRR